MIHSHRTVLLIDDHDDFRNMMADLLTEFGYNVFEADEPMAALDAIARFRPDICLLDIYLPGMDGYDLAVRLRQRSPGILIIVVSGSQRDSTREDESGAMIDAFLTKPFTIKKLQDTLANATMRASVPENSRQNGTLAN
jgi:CheY-like chemotaxis protein